MNGRSVAKPLCVVDASVLIHISGLEMARRPLIDWLTDEFEIRYSEAVYSEIRDHCDRFTRHEKKLIGLLSRKTQQVIGWSTIDTWEKALFGPPFFRMQQMGVCPRCSQPTFQQKEFHPPLNSEDKGERHNCCVALCIVRSKSSHLIFLTDDFSALSKYVEPVFETFPLGSVWSSLDLVLYLFLRYRRHINPEEAKRVLQDLITRIAGPSPAEKWVRRSRIYKSKVDRINQVLQRIPEIKEVNKCMPFL